MNVNISVRSGDITQDTKDYALDKTQRLEKFQLYRADIVMEVEGDEYKIEIVAHPERGGTLVASARGGEWFSAIDQVCDKIERQLRKAKEKIKSHRVKKYQPEQPLVEGDE